MESKNFEQVSEDYVKIIRQSIKSEYGEVPAEWEAQLNQIRDLYYVYLKAAEAIRTEEAVVRLNNGKTPAPNLNFGVMVQCVNSMDKILKQFGLNPIARKKLRGNPVTEDSDFMDEL